MGNCQAAEMAAAVVEYPGGRVERVVMEEQLQVSAQRLMADYPGHFVALISSSSSINVQHVPAPSSSSSAPAAAAAVPPISSSNRTQLNPRSMASSNPAPVPFFKLLAADAPLRNGHRYRLLSFEEVLTCFSQGGGSTYANYLAQASRPRLPAALTSKQQAHMIKDQGRAHSHHHNQLQIYGVKIGC